MRDRIGLVAIGALGLCAWCGSVSGFHTDSAAAVATWCVSTVIVVGADLALWSRQRDAERSLAWPTVAEAWPRPGRGGRRRALIGLSPWLILGGICVTWDLLGIDTGANEAHLTISALAQTFRPVNAILLLAWMLAGLAYGVARARAPRTAPSSTPRSPQALAALAWPGGTPHAASSALLLPSNRPIGLAFWGGACVAGVAIDVISRRSQGAFATAGDAVRFASTTVVARFLLIVAWLFAGYHLFAR